MILLQAIKLVLISNMEESVGQSNWELGKAKFDFFGEFNPKKIKDGIYVISVN